MGMTDREKVIKGLKCCTQHGSMGGRNCNGHWGYIDASHTRMELIGEYRVECTYGSCETGCVKTLAKDALALLKVQEPQMLALEDVRQYAKEGRPFYLEFANGSFGWTVPTNYCQSGFEHGTGETPLLKQFFSYYNKIVPGREYMAFRCWNTTPTEMQMEEEKWQIKQ